MAAEAELGAEGCLRAANFCQIIIQEVAIPGPELRECGALGACECRFGWRDIRAGAVKHSTVFVLPDGVGYDAGVNVLEVISVGRRVDDVVA